MIKSSWRKNERALKGASKYGKSSTMDVHFTPIITTFAFFMGLVRLIKTRMLFAILLMEPSWHLDLMTSVLRYGKSAKIVWRLTVPRKSFAGLRKVG